MGSDPPSFTYGRRPRATDQAMTQAMGDCIASWSHVELSLAQMFMTVVGCKGIVADTIWTSFLSFEPRTTMLHRVLNVQLENSPHLDDWNLLYNYTLKMSKERNKIAHSTLLNFDNKEMVLEPFFVMTKPKPYLHIEDIRAIKPKFEELRLTVMIFSSEITMSPELRSKYPRPVSDLVLRLRAEDAQRRKEQQEQKKPSPG